MASTGTKSPISGSIAQRTIQAHRPLLLTVLSGKITINRAPQSGMGFENLPPLAITSIPFKFLKILDLRSEGLGLDAAPSCFGWELVVWKPLEEQFRAELEGKPAEVFGEVHKVMKIGEETSEEGKIEMDLGTGDTPVHEVGGGDSIF